MHDCPACGSQPRYHVNGICRNCGHTVSQPISTEVTV